MVRIGVVFGTRPEAIKMAPVIKALQKYPQLQVEIITTGQHREMLQQVLDTFEIEAQHRFAVMEPGQSLPVLLAKILQCMDDFFANHPMDMVLVHGDTATALGTALAGFFHQIPVGHVEAGLRTASIDLPFPEEANRRLIDVVTSLYFAPTQTAAANLTAQGVDRAQVFVTGNTVIDALFSVVEDGYEFQSPILNGLDPELPIVVATVHRRENWGQPLDDICAALAQIADEFAVQVVFCMHKNPTVQHVVRKHLEGKERVLLMDAPPYKEFANLMQRSHFVVTDSGGLQEEAPALNKPVLVLRTSTERPEGVTAGTLQLVGTAVQSVVDGMRTLLMDSDVYQRMAAAENPYGDGRAADRIAYTLWNTLNQRGDDHGNTPR